MIPLGRVCENPAMNSSSQEMPPQAARLAPELRSFADRGIYFGTSSWKYEGWLGSIYSEGRYVTRGKLSKAKFEQNCLAEYCETFPTVCGDLTFYQFPSEEYWAKLFDATPEHFVFGFKVPEDITVETWPKHARYGRRAGLPNESFLNPQILGQYFTSRLKRYGKRVGPLIFEFGTFNKKTFPTPADFLAVLDRFLKTLPEGFRYAIEIRNHDYSDPGVSDGPRVPQRCPRAKRLDPNARPGRASSARRHPDGGLHGRQGAATEMATLRQGGRDL